MEQKKPSLVLKVREINMIVFAFEPPPPPPFFFTQISHLGVSSFRSKAGPETWRLKVTVLCFCQKALPSPYSIIHEVWIP